MLTLTHKHTSDAKHKERQSEWLSTPNPLCTLHWSRHDLSWLTLWKDLQCFEFFSTWCPCSVYSSFPSKRSNIFTVESLDVVMRKLPAGWKDKLFTAPLWTTEKRKTHEWNSTILLGNKKRVKIKAYYGMFGLFCHIERPIQYKMFIFIVSDIKLKKIKCSSIQKPKDELINITSIFQWLC